MQVTYNTKIKRFVVTGGSFPIIFDSFNVDLGLVSFYRDDTLQGGLSSDSSDLFLELFEGLMGI